MARKRLGKKRDRARPKSDAESIKPHVPYVSNVLDNESFVKYYKAQNLCKDDQEFDLFLTTMKEPLPAAFRINMSCFGHTQALKNIIENGEFSSVLESNDNEQEATTKGLVKLKWYPHGLAYQLNLSRKEIRDNANMLNLHSFLISETENGYISRQETVSFIPPILLDIKPHHKVLDMCAAPGSKTAQIIELLHASKSVGQKDEGENQGWVVANDVNNPRCCLLAHQCQRFNLPYFLVVNEDASTMPNFFTTNKQTGEREKIFFDRILADVPCTGDGTMRKNGDIWKRWNPQSANHLHALQLRIAKRAAEMLTKDGLMVYSTCSLNPIENEVVVMNLLKQSNGAIELVDVEDKIESLKHLHGLEKWSLMQKNLKLVHCFEQVDEDCRQQLHADLFAPSDVAKYNLKRCVRIMPHLQNTGGFFIAILRKTAARMPWQSAEEQKSIEHVVKKPRIDNRNFKRAYGYKDDPFHFLNADDPEWLKLKEFYKISDDFPCHRLFYRSEKGLTHLNYIADSVRDMYDNSSDNVKFINFGIRVFSRIQDKVATVTHRIAQDGLNILYPYLSKDSIIKISCEEFEKLMHCDEFMDLNELEKGVVDQIDKFPSGCVILEYKLPVLQDNGQMEELALPIVAWKGKSTIRPFVNKHERVHYRRICGFDVSSLDVERKKIFDDRQRRRQERIAKGQKIENNEANVVQNTDNEQITKTSAIESNENKLIANGD